MMDEYEPDFEPLDPEQLSVNELRRFRKRSPNLVLEQYSHCEVPAGCGGVVLRWVNPGAPVPLGSRVFTSGRCPTWYVDGQERDTSRAMVSSGQHVIVLVLSFGENLSPKGERCMAAVSTRFGSVSQHGENLPEATVATTNDGSWQIAVTPPNEAQLGATAPDPTVWKTPEPAEIPEQPQQWAWSWEQCINQGAEAFAVPAGLGTVWLRTVIDIPEHPAARQEGSP